jgi:NADH:ubiquinone oxidoreductase subunit 6 (subunit J)
MLLNLRIVETYLNFRKYIPIGVFLSFIFLMELFCGMNFTFESYSYLIFELFNWNCLINNISNIELIGIVLFNYYWYLFLIVGLILFTAMIGAIIIAWNLDLNFHVHASDFNLKKNIILWNR